MMRAQLDQLVDPAVASLPAHYVFYGMANALSWRRHRYRVSRRFALANRDKVAFGRIAFLKILFVIRGRFRRLIFDA